MKNSEDKFRCDGCGATLRYAGGAGVLRCDFCGSVNEVVLEERGTSSAKGGIEYIIPFRLEDEDLVESARVFLKFAPGAPDDLPMLASVEKIKKMYAPAYVLEDEEACAYAGKALPRAAEAVLVRSFSPESLTAFSTEFTVDIETEAFYLKPPARQRQQEKVSVVINLGDGSNFQGDMKAAFVSNGYSKALLPIACVLVKYKSLFYEVWVSGDDPNIIFAVDLPKEDLPAFGKAMGYVPFSAALIGVYLSAYIGRTHTRDWLGAIGAFVFSFAYAALRNGAIDQYVEQYKRSLDVVKSSDGSHKPPKPFLVQLIPHDAVVIPVLSFLVVAVLLFKPFAFADKPSVQSSPPTTTQSSASSSVPPVVEPPSAGLIPAGNAEEATVVMYEALAQAKESRWSDIEQAFTNKLFIYKPSNVPPADKSASVREVAKAQNMIWQKRLPEARATLANAQKLDPYNQAPYTHMVRMYLGQGEAQRAKDLLEKGFPYLYRNTEFWLMCAQAFNKTEKDDYSTDKKLMRSNTFAALNLASHINDWPKEKIQAYFRETAGEKPSRLSAASALLIERSK